MFNWLKEEKFQFFCTIPGVSALFPISPMKEYRPRWLTEAAKAFAAHKKAFCIDNAEQHVSISKCPGIRTLFTTGWLLRNWQDIIIRISADGTYTWKSVVDQTAFPDTFEAVSEHRADTFLSSEYLRTKVPIIKINTPWRVHIPDGYEMYQKGVPYQEHDWFTVGEGILTSEYGATDINIQLLFNAPGEYVIKAGMPLAHLIPIRRSQPSAVIRDMNESDLRTMTRNRVLSRHSFITDYNKIKATVTALKVRK